MKRPCVDEQTYRIGAVSRLTGIPSETLRVWERRYRVVRPAREEGRFRLYSREDVSRLALLKRLVDSGHAIGSIAALPMEQLQERIQTDARRGMLTATGIPETPVRLAVMGSALAAQFSRVEGDLAGVEIVARERSRADLDRALADSTVDVLALEFPVVNTETLAEVNDALHVSGAGRAIVVYGFGRREALHRLETSRIMVVRAPVDLMELRRICVETVEGGCGTRGSASTGLASGPIPPCRFDAETLSRISAASTTVDCECPRHLVDLINGLRAFEHYSAECESRSEEDAVLHAHLHSVTAQARATLENALARVVEAKCLHVPGNSVA